MKVWSLGLLITVFSSIACYGEQSRKTVAQVGEDYDDLPTHGRPGGDNNKHWKKLFSIRIDILLDIGKTHWRCRRYHARFKCENRRHRCCRYRNRVKSAQGRMCLSIFKKFHNIGLVLIGRGIVYSGYYFKLKCNAFKFYSKYRRCLKHRNANCCLKRMQGRGFIGHRHIYKRFGRTFGLGVRFVKNGIEYKKQFFRYNVDRVTFIRYMTICMESKAETNFCIQKFRNQRYIVKEDRRTPKRLFSGKRHSKRNKTKKSTKRKIFQLKRMFGKKKSVMNSNKDRKQYLMKRYSGRFKEIEVKHTKRRLPKKTGNVKTKHGSRTLHKRLHRSHSRHSRLTSSSIISKGSSHSLHSRQSSHSVHSKHISHRLQSKQQIHDSRSRHSRHKMHSRHNSHSLHQTHTSHSLHSRSSSHRLHPWQKSHGLHSKQNSQSKHSRHSSHSLHSRLSSQILPSRHSSHSIHSEQNSHGLHSRHSSHSLNSRHNSHGLHSLQSSNSIHSRLSSHSLQSIQSSNSLRSKHNSHGLHSRHSSHSLHSMQSSKSLHSRLSSQNLHSRQSSHSIHSRQRSHSLHSRHKSHGLHSRHSSHSLHSRQKSHGLHSRHSNHSLHSRHSSHSLHSRHSSHTLHSRLSSQNLYSRQSSHSIHSRQSSHSIHSRHSSNSLHSRHKSHGLHSRHSSHSLNSRHNIHGLHSIQSSNGLHSRHSSQNLHSRQSSHSIHSKHSSHSLNYRHSSKNILARLSSHSLHSKQSSNSLHRQRESIHSLKSDRSFHSEISDHSSRARLTSQKIIRHSNLRLNATHDSSVFDASRKSSHTTHSKYNHGLHTSRTNHSFTSARNIYQKSLRSAIRRKFPLSDYKRNNISDKGSYRKFSAIISWTIFAEFERLGVKLVGRGIVYHKKYFPLNCGYNKAVFKMKQCVKQTNVLDCLKSFVRKAILRRAHTYRRFGLCFGLGVMFKRKGIFYNKNAYKILIKRRLFIKYLTVCENNYKGIDICIKQLQTQGFLTKVHQSHAILKNADVTINDRSVKLDGNDYILACNRRLFEKKWKRCMQVFHKVKTCIRSLHTSFLNYKLYGSNNVAPRTKHYILLINKIGLRVYGRGFLYKGFYYKILSSFENFYQTMKGCIAIFDNINKCLPRLYDSNLIGQRKVYQRYGKGFGLGVKFVKHGIIYEETYMKIHVFRRRFMQYMTLCEEATNTTKGCVRKCQNNGMLGKSHQLKQIKTNLITKHFSKANRHPHTNNIHTMGKGSVMLTDHNNEHAIIKDTTKHVNSKHNIHHNKKHKIQNVNIEHNYQLGTIKQNTHYGNGEQSFQHDKIDDNSQHGNIEHNTHHDKIDHNHQHVNIYHQPSGTRITHHVSHVDTIHTSNMNIENHMGIFNVKQTTSNVSPLYQGEHIDKNSNTRTIYNNKIRKHVKNDKSRHGKSLEETKGNHHHIQNIRVGRIFYLYRKLGLKLEGNGILYKHKYYEIRSDYRAVYKILRLCIPKTGDRYQCLMRLRQKNMIGPAQKPKLKDCGLGLGVTFTGQGLVYDKLIYSYMVKQSVVVRYLTVCEQKYPDILLCLHQLQKQAILGTTNPFTSSTENKRVKWRSFIFHRKKYRLICRKDIFHRKLRLCMRRLKNKDACFKILRNLFEPGSNAINGKLRETKQTIKRKKIAVGEIVVGPIFRLFRRLGVRLVGRGILYERSFFKLRCDHDKLYNKLRQCTKSNEVQDCLQDLRQEGLISGRHAFRRFGSSYGLGVTFSRKGMVYQHNLYRFKIRRRRFIRYMTSCMFEYGDTKGCLKQLQKQDILKAAVAYEKPVDHDFKIRCDHKKLYKKLRQCTKSNEVEDCLKQFRQKGLISGRHAFRRFGRSYGLGVTFVRKGVVYQHNFYKLKIRRRRFIRYVTTCMFEYDDTKGCLKQLQKQDILKAAVIYERPVDDDISRSLQINQNLNSHNFVYNGTAYRLKVTLRRFYRLWRKCMRKNKHVFICFSQLHGLFKPSELYHKKLHNDEVLRPWKVTVKHYRSTATSEKHSTDN